MVKRYFFSTCTSGENHTITLSNDGTVYAFGVNTCGQLGLIQEQGNQVSIPTPILDLPKIKEISCGAGFTACVDYEGFLWTFGNNYNGQLGTGNKTNCYAPVKILNIPLVFSVSCGYEHTLIITKPNENLWACGNNMFGQLCLKNQDDQITFQATSFSFIARISAGYFHSLFQDNRGDIFSCGANNGGALVLGHFEHPQITPTKIPNLPSNITQFICGGSHNLFLDSEGNVFSVGMNDLGQLGLADTDKRCSLTQIENIPPIHTISCSGESSYLIDFEGNLWSFGTNSLGQLGHGDTTHRLVPTKIETLKEIQQVTNSAFGSHFLVKDSRNTIFVLGYNGMGQLGLGYTNPRQIKIPKEMNSKYFSIWGEVSFRAKSARK